MTLRPRSRLTFYCAGAAVALTVASTRPLAAQGSKPAQAPAKTTVASMAASLEQLLPRLAGWTTGRTNSRRIDVSDNCSYDYADAVYTNGTMKVRVTLADTAGDPAALAVLATMVTTLANDYSGTIDGTTSVKRVTFNGSPAASRWDSAKLDGEFMVVLGGRFVAKAEGTGIDSIETLRGFVEQVDLKALAELK